MDLITDFFNMIGSTSAYEAIRTANASNDAVLKDKFNNAKFSYLGTPVLDYVELTLYKDMLEKPQSQKTTKPAFGNPTDIEKLKAKGTSLSNRFKMGIADQKFLHGINQKTVHLNEVEIAINQTANIVHTSINGKSGTFKEFYNNGDYLISLNGSLTGVVMFQNDLQNLNNFARIALSNQRFNIKSDFINNIFGLYDVVMTDWSFTLNRDYNNVVDYSISLESDTDIEIIYNI